MLLPLLCSEENFVNKKVRDRPGNVTTLENNSTIVFS